MRAGPCPCGGRSGNHAAVPAVSPAVAKPAMPARFPSDRGRRRVRPPRTLWGTSRKAEGNRALRPFRPIRAPLPLCAPLPHDMVPSEGRWWTGSSPTRSGPEGSSRNGFSLGSSVRPSTLQGARPPARRATASQDPAARMSSTLSAPPTRRMRPCLSEAPPESPARAAAARGARPVRRRCAAPCPPPRRRPRPSSRRRAAVPPWPPRRHAPTGSSRRKYRPRTLRRADRPGRAGPHPAQRLRAGPHGACLHAHRRARRRQDHHRPHHRPRAELHRPRRHRRPDPRALRRLPGMQGDPRRPPPRRAGARRRLQQRLDECASCGAACATARPRRATRSSSSTRSTCCRRRRSTRC